MADTPKAEETSIIEFLRDRLRAAENLLQRPEVSVGPLFVWTRAVRFQLEKIYGKDSPLLGVLPGREMDRSIADPRAELTKRVQQARRLIEALEAVPNATKSPLLGKKIFIGHGHSHVWLQLKVFLNDQLHLPCDEFNLKPAAGMATTARLDDMVAQARFAFIVMTAEDEHADGLVYARPNVIHETGLFQGKLSTLRAIILLEKGCSIFSNIAGLAYIPFPKDDLIPALEPVRRVLEREGLTSLA